MSLNETAESLQRNEAMWLQTSQTSIDNVNEDMQASVRMVPSQSKDAIRLLEIQRKQVNATLLILESRRNAWEQRERELVEIEPNLRQHAEEPRVWKSKYHE